jgi:hypothetical protein
MLLRKRENSTFEVVAMGSPASPGSRSGLPAHVVEARRTVEVDAEMHRYGLSDGDRLEVEISDLRLLEHHSRERRTVGLLVIDESVELSQVDVDRLPRMRQLVHARLVRKAQAHLEALLVGIPDQAEFQVGGIGCHGPDPRAQCLLNQGIFIDYSYLR